MGLVHSRVQPIGFVHAISPVMSLATSAGGRDHRRSARTSARWRARRPESASICVRQLKPSASRGVSGSAARRAGSSSSSATACAMASCPRSAPKLPARPQQPESSLPHDDAVALHDPTVGVEAQHGLLVAVRLGDGGSAAPACRRAAWPAATLGCPRRHEADAVEELGEGRDAPGQGGGARVIRQQLPEVLAQHRGAGGLQHDHRFVAGQLRCAQRAPQHPPGHVQLARGVPRQAAAHRPPGDDDLEAGRLQHAHRGVGDVRRQVVVEGVRPEHDAAACARRGGVGRAGPELAPCGPA